jgi:hypothetical protein
MPVMMAHLYSALRAADCPDNEARLAAEAARPIDTTQLATKADLAELKADLLRWNIGLLLSAAGINIGVMIALLKMVHP